VRGRKLWKKQRQNGTYDYKTNRTIKLHKNKIIAETKPGAQKATAGMMPAVAWINIGNME